ncbi:hypothetical protein BJX63DRAFT_75172 [Aspergillus granulosus]|uniref:Secreted protein n=1 Tax=Aspergillus granulosus TaxID=176169 RepID=A0ABR4GWF9_9EURO
MISFRSSILPLLCLCRTATRAHKAQDPLETSPLWFENHGSMARVGVWRGSTCDPKWQGSPVRPWHDRSRMDPSPDLGSCGGGTLIYKDLCGNRVPCQARKDIALNPRQNQRQQIEYSEQDRRFVPIGRPSRIPQR